MNEKTKKAIIAVSAVSAVAALALLYVFSVSFDLILWKLFPTKLPSAFTITAHSGCEGTTADSLESIIKGYEAGADIVEIDLNMTGDGICVLSHDAPTEDGVYVTADSAFESIASLPGLRVNMDLKTTDVLDDVYEIILKYDLIGRVFFTGVGEDRVAAVKEHCPDIDFYLGVGLPKKYDDEYIDGLIERVKSCGAVGININQNDLSAKLVKKFHENDLLVSVWTVDKTVRILYVLSCAPDNVTTRRPSTFKKFVAKGKYANTPYMIAVFRRFLLPFFVVLTLT